MIELEASLKKALSDAANIDNEIDRAKVILEAAKTLPKNAGAIPSFEESLMALNEVQNPDDRRLSLEALLREIPLDEDFLQIYHRTTDLLMRASEEMSDERARKTAMCRVLSNVPSGPLYEKLYMEATRRTIAVANRMGNVDIRRASLMSIANDLPREDKFIELRLHATALALGLSKEPQNKENDLALIAHELPKSCDYEFYRNKTFFGVIEKMPKTGSFFPLYTEAIEVAVHASEIIDEPFFRKFALIIIAEELPKSDEFIPLYKKIMSIAIAEAVNIREPFARHYALLDILKALPKSSEFIPLIITIIENLLPFYSLKSRMEDVNALDVIDYIIVAEERKMNDNKKSRYMREHYAKLFAIEIGGFVKELNDIRFVELLKPFSHIWIQPPILRNTARELIEHLKGIKSRFHGKEILRPDFLKESHLQDKFAHLTKASIAAAHSEAETVAIDLGATNTVIMIKRAKKPPEFVYLDSISKKTGGVSIVPTLLDRESQCIGTEATGEDRVTDLKRRLIDGSKGSKRDMQLFFELLYEQIKDEFTPVGWLRRLYSAPAETLYLSVPIGYSGYSRSIKEILEKTARSIRTEIVEEPLAAAIGYQVAGDKDKVIMLIDFGGCTLDIMVLRVNIDRVHVVAKPDRSTMLGGSDIDQWLAEFLAEKAGIKTDPLPQALIEAAEEIKIALSERSIVPFQWKGNEICKVTRAEFEAILDSRDFYKAIDRTISYVIKKTEKIGVSSEKIEDILLCGGSSQIPSFKEKVGDLFPELRATNKIYDHSPLTAVAEGAALYGTREVTDRHLASAYAMRFKGGDPEKPHSYELIFEKGEPLPFEKSFSITPAETLGPQREAFIELFEVPDNQIVRRWERYGGREYIKQIIKQPLEVELKALKVVTLGFTAPITAAVEVTFIVGEDGALRVSYGEDKKEIGTGIRLQ